MVNGRAGVAADGLIVLNNAADGTSGH
jgi:hypothetical protein